MPLAADGGSKPEEEEQGVEMRPARTSWPHPSFLLSAVAVCFAASYAF